MAYKYDEPDVRSRMGLGELPDPEADMRKGLGYGVLIVVLGLAVGALMYVIGNAIT